MAACGTLVVRKGYGAPGFGETPEIDDKIFGIALKLSKQIKLKIDDEDRAGFTIKTAKELQIFYNGKTYKALISKVGQGALVKGTISESETGFQLTDYILQADSIKICKSGCNEC